MELQIRKINRELRKSLLEKVVQMPEGQQKQELVEKYNLYII